MRYHVGVGCSFGEADHNAHGLLAKRLDANFINLSRRGRGNFSIYTELLYWISLNKEKLEHTTFSIGWSGIFRNDFIQGPGFDHWAFRWDKWRGDRDCDVHRSQSDRIDLYTDQTVRFMTHVISTQDLLTNLGCRFVMYNGIDTHIPRSAFGTKSGLTVKLLEQKIDKNRFYKFDYSHSKFVADNRYFLDPTPQSIITKIINYPTGGTQYPVKDAHPSPEGDERWADLLWEFCKKNQLL